MMNEQNRQTRKADSQPLPAPRTAPSAVTPDPALLSAWRRFLDYDQISTEQKKNYVSIRSVVIALILLTTSFAVFTTLLPEGSFLRELLRLALIVMPVVAVAVINYASQFAASGIWVEYRVSAEIIRSHIYLYRAQAGHYHDQDLYQRQQLLLKAVDEADDRISPTDSVPYLRAVDSEDIIARIQTRTDDGDDGLSPLDGDKYIAWRAKPQMNWYIDKIRDDYSQSRRVGWLALVIGGAGSVISAILPSYTGLVAITTALGVALAQYSSVRMYGATYGLFHKAANDLQDTLSRWNILPSDQKTSELSSQIVARFEDILSTEREMWRSQALEMQTSNEQAIYQTLSVKSGIQAAPTGAGSGSSGGASRPVDDQQPSG